MPNMFRKIRASFNLGSIITGSFGAGMSIVGGFLPYTGWDISKPTARLLVYLGIVLVVIALILVVVKYLRQREKFEELLSDEVLTLRGIHKRMTLLTDKTSKLKIDQAKSEDAVRLVLDAFGIVKLADFDKRINKIKTAIETKANKENDIDKERIIQIASEQFRRQIKISQPNKVMTIGDVFLLGKILDGTGIGLQIAMDRDRKYQRLNEQIQNIKASYSDKKLGQLIDVYLYASYGLNSYSLYVAYSKRLDIYNLAEKTYPVLAQKNWRNTKMQSDIIMSSLLTNIIQRIKALKKPETKND